MRFRTTLTIEPARRVDVTLTQLNDDCLLLICENLSLGDQLRLLELGEQRLHRVVLRIWARKYSNHFDWRREGQLKLLTAAEQWQLLNYLGGRTKALLNLPGGGSLCRMWLNRRRKHALAHLQQLGFSECHVRLLQDLPSVCPNLVDLQLGKGVGISRPDLCLLFTELQHLRGFGLRNCLASNDATASPTATRLGLELGPKLQSLKLPACVLRGNAAEIFELPKLRQLTGFLCRNDDDDDDKANASGTATLSTCLRQLRQNRRRPCQIVALRLQCQLDGSLPSGGEELDLFRLQRFAWHSQLTVHYDVADGSIKWLPQWPQAVRRFLLPFLATQAGSLRQLDFTRNLHATPTFFAQLAEAQLLRPGISVCHDACPPPQTDTDADAETNDLALVELELLHLPNEQRKRIPER
ncbi:hypothetical protein KR018_006318 [Drosophila ironensis]|nr:hypothetical protein KR018_006318 [Drosophila ironensis]